MHKIALLVFVLLLAACASSPPRLNQPFVLHAGETMRVEPDGFEITLRSVADDSGCFSPTDCSTMVFIGSIAVRLGDKTNLIQAGSILKTGSVLKLDLDGYAFHLTDVRRNARNQLEVTFIVLGRSN
jgi:hypothetical protein